MSEILRAMPPNLQTGQVDATRDTNEQFLEMLCADDELLQIEFDAIIAAEWRGPTPPRPVDHPDSASGPRSGARRESDATDVPHHSRRPGVGWWSRQRSPPQRNHDFDER